MSNRGVNWSKVPMHEHTSEAMQDLLEIAREIVDHLECGETCETERDAHDNMTEAVKACNRLIALRGEVLLNNGEEVATS